MAHKQGETNFKEKVLPLLKALPCSWFEKIQQLAIRGTPDILGCVRGQMVALELKTEDGDTDALQDWNLNKILKAGGMAIVVTPTNWPEVYNSLKLMADGKMEFKKVNKNLPFYRS